MNFVTFDFLLFFAAAAVVYYIIPKKFQWMVLLAASVWFYGQTGLQFLVFPLTAVVVTYAAALAIGRTKEREKTALEGLGREERKAAKARFSRIKTLICAASVVITLGILAVMKYGSFLLSILSAENAGALAFVLPLGISFYTFQSIGYCIDVNRGTCEPEKNILKYALYVMYFPQILQGPIGNYPELAPQLFEAHSFDYDNVMFGIQRILWGFFKKLVVAERAAVIVNTVFDNCYSYDGLYVAVAAVGYAIQLYADFSGYMDIALGVSQVFGIRLRENFQTPYFSRSIAEFWRRWHICLGAWFRDYLFYSLMRTSAWKKLQKQCKKLPKKLGRDIPTACALAVVWLCIGLWHGAAWKYIAHGIYHGGMIILALLLKPVTDKLTEKLRIRTDTDSWKLFQMLRTFLLVCVGYLLFRGASLHAALHMLRSLFTVYNPWILNSELLPSLGLDAANCRVLLLGVAVMLGVDICNEKGIVVRQWIAKQQLWLRWSVYLLGFFTVLIFGCYGLGFDASAFIYFQF
ncbi:MAG: MBOAT family O-acyltransferase [Faecousia sp.]